VRTSEGGSYGIPYGTVLVYVKVSIENTSNDQFMAADFVLEDAEGRTFHIMNRSGSAAFISGAIPGGKSYGGTAKYLVPETAYNLDVHHYVPGLGPAVWELPW
jgi:hypothetical protein